jgi:hypothetical protein
MAGFGSKATAAAAALSAARRNSAIEIDANEPAGNERLVSTFLNELVGQCD